MKTGFAIALLLPAAPLIAQTVGEWEAAGFDRAAVTLASEEDLYPSGRPGELSHGLDLTAVILRGSNWNRKRATEHLRRTAGILSACRIGLGRVTIVEAGSPVGGADIDVASQVDGSAIPRDVYALSTAAPPNSDWPLVFFAGRLIGVDDVALSYQQGDVEAVDLPRFPYMNTAWIAYRTHWMERREREYSSVAHELGHLLCACGHRPSSDPHLLHAYRNFLGVQVLSDHCEMFRRSPLVRKTPSR